MFLVDYGMKNSKIESNLHDYDEVFDSFLRNEEDCVDASTIQETALMFGLNFSLTECVEMTKYPIDFGGAIDRKSLERILSMTIVYF